ncbi:hypothetical protein [Bryobacter aggregatus]|uniref:phosphorylase family protein n=1 Tax=Bryobacter aggregatus TaxID=360054 RepID=UPI0004E0E270|nr:hypothetical protein [Bryobacter aggregatus]
MDKILVLCAMGLEAKAVPARYQTIVTGVGFRNAQRSAAEAIQRYRPDLVLSIGTCGALDPRLELGTVLSPSAILSPIGNFNCLRLEAQDAVLYSQDRVAVTVADKRALHGKGASVVDMEAAVIAREAAKAGVQFGCLKAVSDLASEDLPLDFNLYRGPNGDFRNSRIAFAGIMKIGALMRLQQQSKMAARQLGEAIDHAIANIT